MTDPADEPNVGVGPHPDPWPDDPRLDRDLLAGGDRRNVVDGYRYWTVDAIVADPDAIGLHGGYTLAPVEDVSPERREWLVDQLKSFGIA